MSEENKDQLQDDNSIGEVQEEIQTKTEDIDPFTRLMFGSNRHGRGAPMEQGNEDKVNDQNQVDYVQLMTQLDEIMGSVNRIKPMLKELSPLLDFFKKKK